MRELLTATAERAIRYLESLEDRGVAPTPEALSALARFDEPLPDGPTEPEQVLALLDEVGSPASIAMAGRRYFGFVIGGVLPAASPRLAPRVAGMEEADSWATDGHKTLNVPYDSGLAFARDPEALRAAMAITAEYLPTAGSERNPSDFTPELSRRARGIDVWAAMRQLGRSGIAGLVDGLHDNARRMAAGLVAAGFEVLNEVAFNQVLVSFGEPAETLRVIVDLQRDGVAWCGATEWQGRTAMRISVSSWATTEQDVDQTIAAIVRVAQC